VRRALIVALLTCTTTLAHAGPRQVLVLRSEGNADTPSRTSVDTHVLRLARHIDGKIEAGDITLTDAAAAAGCDATNPTCKDEILATFGMDEIVTTTVNKQPGELKIVVRRLAKTSAPRTAQSTIPVGRPPEAKLDADLGPLFDIKAAPTAEKAVATEPDKKLPTEPVMQPPATEPPEPTSETPPPTETQPEATPAPVPTTPAQTDTRSRSRSMPKIGMGVGAGMVVLSFVLWGKASSLQSEIDTAPANTAEDFTRLRELESNADGYAAAGNLMFVGGLVIGGVSTYFYWKKRKQARTRAATVLPMLTPHGAGLVLSFGGAR
jgi:hypothetical protein